MARYLTPAWFQEVDAAAAAAAGDGAGDGGDAGTGVTIQQVVTGGPDGDVRYWVRLAGGRVETGRGDAEQADATVTQSYDTAAEVSQGRLGVEDAILQGRIRVAGDLALLVRHQSALVGAAGAFDEVRARTTYEG